MIYTANINLPIVENDDLYSKEINNLAFERIDTEIKGLSDKLETLESPENSLNDVKEDVKNINVKLTTLNNKFRNIYIQTSIPTAQERDIWKQVLN